MTSKNFSDAVAEVRHAVRVGLAEFKPADLVLVACSGGSDSLALAKAASLECAASHVSIGAIVIDHGWNSKSTEICAKTAQKLVSFDLAPVVVEKLPDHEHNETTARDLRYQAFGHVAQKLGAAGILLAHNKNDQAETVLLRLARGSGSTSLAGMPPKRDAYHRPLLEVDRSTIEAACRQWGLDPWQDPANSDEKHLRVKVRKRVLPALVDALGPTVVESLARSASLLRDDAELLDSQAMQVFDAFFDATDRILDADKLAQEPAALTRRVLLLWISELGVERSLVNSTHTFQLESLLHDKSESRQVSLPGNFVAYRQGQALHCERS